MLDAYRQTVLRNVIIKPLSRTIMGKIYFYGGEDVKRRTCLKANKKIFSQFYRPRVLVIPWTTENKVKELKYRRILQEYFRDLGAEEISFLEKGCPLDILEEYFENADILYLPGGETEFLLKSIKEERIEELIKEFPGVIMGNSAGALVLGKYCIIGKREYSLSLKKGLGLVDFSIYVHYNPKRDFEIVKELARGRFFRIARECNPGI
ncbi:MAG: hypothetical protein DRJ38_05990 [Thermoprotei archaeon]|nr:MAG: hypothetical protein DRJ38_05990 [Thermoprotei archaeon]